MAVTIDGDGTITGTGFLPAGLLAPYAGATAPEGWLLCAGQAVSRTEYAGLFAAVGTTYGTGDGSTTFNLPDMRGRVAAGVDNMGGTDAGRLDWQNILGTVGPSSISVDGGTQTHTLTAAQSGVPAHNHTTVNAGSHRHRQTWINEGSTVANQNRWTTAAGFTFSDQSNLQEAAGDHSHTINNNTAANASQAHNNMQPTILLNYIIKV